MAGTERRIPCVLFALPFNHDLSSHSAKQICEGICLGKDSAPFLYSGAVCAIVGKIIWASHCEVRTPDEMENSILQRNPKPGVGLI